MFPWLVGIARNLSSDTARRRQRERRALARVAGERSLDEDEITELEERIDAARWRGEVEDAFKRLNGAEREALWLVGPLGLTGMEAAEALGLTPASFRMRLMRARRSLRRALRRASSTEQHESRTEEARL